VPRLGHDAGDRLAGRHLVAVLRGPVPRGRVALRAHVRGPPLLAARGALPVRLTSHPLTAPSRATRSPFCVDTCQDLTHSCPNCGFVIRRKPAFTD